MSRAEESSDELWVSASSTMYRESDSLIGSADAPPSSAAATALAGPNAKAIRSIGTRNRTKIERSSLLDPAPAGKNESGPVASAAWAVESFFRWFEKFRRFLPMVQKASGALLILVGVLLVSGQFTRMAAWLQGLKPDFLRNML